MISHLGQSNIVTASYSTFQLFLVILGGQNGPQGGLRGESEKNFDNKPQAKRSDGEYKFEFYCLTTDLL